MTKRKANNTGEKRVEYVRIAIRLMEEEGIDALSIRRVAQEAGCTSAVLYRHFVNKENLLMIAAVKHLVPYIQEFVKQYTRKDITYIQKDLINWKLFITEAFHKKMYYELYFTGEEKDVISECIVEYYQMFPEEQKRFDGLTASIAMNTNMEERGWISLRRAANQGLITMRNAGVLSKLTAAVFYGRFLRVPAAGADEKSLQKMADECYELIYELFRKYVNPGTVLEVR